MAFPYAAFSAVRFSGMQVRGTTGKDRGHVPSTFETSGTYGPPQKLAYLSFRMGSVVELVITHHTQVHKEFSTNSTIVMTSYQYFQ